MTDIPKEIVRLHYNEFCAAVDEHSNDREALVSIKDAMEVEKSFNKDKPDIHVWYVRKTLYLDSLLRKLKPQKKNPQQQANAQTALIVTLEWDDEEDRMCEQFATMMNLSDFMVGVWQRHKEEPWKTAKVLAYWQCPHLGSIPDHIWDETKPEWLAQGFIPDVPEPHHELFSR